MASKPPLSADSALLNVSQRNADKTVATILGEIVWLMSRSPEHKDMRIGELETFAMPAILLRQFRIFYHEGRPAGAVLYARVSDEVHARLADGGSSQLQLDEWKCGRRLAVISTIAPFGGGSEFAQETMNTLGALP